ncbi:MAG TPA: VWA domain-containing protein [Terracidiphilus sp.]|nr:VWA domain-containing protein [Terracidiphilus sp.]
MTTPRTIPQTLRRLQISVLFLAVAAFVAAPLCTAQSQTQSASQQQQDQTAPAAGGPSGDTGVIAVPKKKDNSDEVPPAPPAPPEPKVTNPAGMPPVSLHIDVPEVTVDVGVLLKKTGQFVPGLKPENFRVYEDGVQQKVLGFKRVEAPITALLLCEFAARGWIFRMDMLNSAWAFTQQLRPQDYVALMTFDMKTHIYVDFTQDKNQIQQAINELGMSVFMPAAFSETNVFDALYESMDRLSRIPGQKYIILIASGIDTMSKLTFDKILKAVKNSQDITIYAISTGGLLREMTEGQGGMMQSMRDMDYLQADNEMRTFASLTGGMWFEPKFTGELPDMVRTINENIRAKYELVYRPTNTKQDGTYRKLRVELVDDEGNPLRMQDQKRKPLQYQIVARDGYRARQEVE